MSLGAVDERNLRAAIALATCSRENGNHPFGSLLTEAGGAIVLEAENTVVTDADVTAHAELNLVRAASRQFAPTGATPTRSIRAPSPAPCAPGRSTGPASDGSSSR